MTYEADGRVARITLDRPERGNGITLETAPELTACVERANLDPEVHAIALAGNGKGFCGGYDLASAEGLGSEQPPSASSQRAPASRDPGEAGIRPGADGSGQGRSPLDPVAVARNHEPG